jgi:hypothetical protein
VSFSILRVRATVALGAFALLAGVLAPPAAATSDPACGPLSSDGFHEVSTVAQLEAVARDGAGTGDCQRGAKYRLMNDIDLDGAAWTPIPDGFNGTFDGDGYRIHDFTMNISSGFNGGFFVSVSGDGLVTGVHLRDFAATVSAGFGTGALVGDLGGSGVVEKSSAVGSIESTALDTGGLVGGLGGDAVVRYSWADVDVSSTSAVVGGLVAGAYNGTISDSFARGSVSGGDGDVGGLVGFVGNGRVSRGYATGAVVGTPFPESAGGAIGRFGPEEDWGSAELEVTFWDRETTGQSLSGDLDESYGSDDARATAQMKRLATFRDAGWLIVNGWAPFDPDPDSPTAAVWGISPDVNDGYPYLLWEYSAENAPRPIPPDPDPEPTVSFLLSPDGSIPSALTGVAVWQQADGTTVPLAVSSPAPGQVRYEADGVRLTLTGGAGTSASRGLVANAAGEVECEICAVLAAGGVTEAWMFSTPRLVAAWSIEDLPCQTFTIPVVAPLDGGGPVSAGAHTLQLALPTASGMQAVNVGVTVGGPVPASVPAGEGPTVPVGLLAFGALAAVGAVVAARRQVVTG